VAFFLLQVALTSLHRAPSWDEAVYLSQVTPGGNAVFFAPSRARGIALIVAPLTLVGAPLWLVRLSLACLSSLGLVVAFRCWVPLLGRATPIAAGLFGFSWLAVFYGSEVMPNLWIALLGLGAAALTVRAVVDRPPRSVAIFVLLAAASLVRPPDAVVLALVLGGFALLAGTPRAVPLALAAGAAAGWVPWLVEMSLRFGGVAEAIRAAGTLAHIGSVSLLARLRAQLSLTDGPTIVTSSGAALPLAGLAWWLGLVGLSAWAVLRDGRGRPWILAMAACGLALFVEYVGAVGGLAPRFLLPAYAFFAVPAARGAYLLATTQGNAGSVVRASLVVTMAAWVLWQGSVAHRIALDAARSRETFAQIGGAIRDLVGTRPCRFQSAEGYPQIQLASNCAGGQLGRGDVLPAASAGEPKGLNFVVAMEGTAQSRAVGWTPIARIDSGSAIWLVLRPSTG
jgi:hypothetical protein